MSRTLTIVLGWLLLVAAASGQGVDTTAAGDEPVAGPEVTLRWKAQNEERAYGYLVYRAESRQGPYRRVSDQIIRVLEDDEGETSAYSWTDRGVVAGTTYYYYLDIVSVGGIKQRFSGVLSRKAEPPTPEVDSKQP